MMNLPRRSSFCHAAALEKSVSDGLIEEKKVKAKDAWRL